MSIDEKENVEIQNEQQTIHLKCLRCKRTLKNPIYKQIGYGKVCLEKTQLPNKDTLFNEMKRLFDEKKKKK